MRRSALLPRDFVDLEIVIWMTQQTIGNAKVCLMKAVHDSYEFRRMRKPLYLE